MRNNLLISAAGSGFASTDHQGKTTRLEVIHNTIINTGHAFSGGSWNGREGMVLANNLIYSRDANALHFANGSEGVKITGNVLFGSGDKRGQAKGRGLAEDLPGLAWDASSRDATPAANAPFLVADEAFHLPTDFAGKPRTGPISGAVAP